MVNNPFNLLETVDVGGMQCYLVTKEVLDDYIYLKESSRRKGHARKLMTKAEVLETLGCSDSTLYRKMRKKGCKIRRGNVNGTYISQSVLEELNK
tara:strand:- start:22874 stop:23158 length:285 start_codon:yes stop_codon:yes gene_type:complete